MKIHVLCRDGSPLGVTMKSLHGTDGRLGVGGAEQALLTLCEAWKQRGDDLVLYNNPSEGNASPFEQRPITSFDPDEKRDILIAFRSPSPIAASSRGKKIWFSCDQRTIDDFAAFSKVVDNVVVISPFHAFYFKTVYNIEGTTVIDLPVRTWEYSLETIEKEPNQILFSSVPDRGLNQLAEVWKFVEIGYPDARLVITSDWRLWDPNFPASATVQYRLKFAAYKNISYLGAIPRSDLVKLQVQSQILAYPCVYPELFCYSVAEASVAGAYPMVSSIGALPTTNEGETFTGSPDTYDWQKAFADKIIYYLNNKEELLQKQLAMVERAKQRFSINTILKKWDTVFNG